MVRPDLPCHGVRDFHSSQLVDVMETALGPEERTHRRSLLPDRRVRAVFLRQRWLDTELRGRTSFRDVLSLVLDPVHYTNGADDQKGRQRGDIRSLLLLM